MKHISFSCQSKGTSVSCNCWRSAKEAEAAAEETWDEEAKLRPLLVKKKKVEAAEQRDLFGAWISRGC